MKKLLAIALIVCLLVGVAVSPVNSSLAYSEDPLAEKDLKEFGAAPTEETIPEENIIPEDTVVPETEALPEVTAPLETAPVPETTAPQETEPVVPSVEEEQPAETIAEEVDPNAPRGHNGVPLYFQTDYPNEIYGMGTIASNGCSAACLAMVATYLTGHEYLPDEIGRYFGGGAENNIARLELGSETMQLPFEKSENWHQTVAALKEGKIVVTLYGPYILSDDVFYFATTPKTDKVWGKIGGHYFCYAAD